MSKKKNFGPKKFLGLNIFWFKKVFGSKNLLAQKEIVSKKKFLGQKKLWVKKEFGQKKILKKKLVVKKNMGQKIFWVKKIKSMGRLKKNTTNLGFGWNEGGRGERGFQVPNLLMVLI